MNRKAWCAECSFLQYPGECGHARTAVAGGRVADALAALGYHPMPFTGVTDGDHRGLLRAGIALLLGEYIVAPGGEARPLYAPLPRSPR